MATWVALNHAIDWSDLQVWAFEEGMAEAEWLQFRQTANKEPPKQ